MRLDAVAGDPGLYSHAVILIGRTQIDECARHPGETREINVTGLLRLIDDLEACGVIPVFLSSDAVFNGRGGNYRETDEVDPVLEYGRQKAEVEAYLRARCRRHLIVRLARVVGDEPGDGTILTRCADDLLAGRQVRCASDQIFSPLHVDDAACGIARLIRQDLAGTFHLAGGRAFSRAQLGQMVLEGVKRFSPVLSGVEVCSIDDFPFPERRPRDTSLCIAKIESSIGFQPRTIEACIEQMLRRRFPGVS